MTVNDLWTDPGFWYCAYWLQSLAQALLVTINVLSFSVPLDLSVSLSRLQSPVHSAIFSNHLLSLPSSLVICSTLPSSPVSWVTQQSSQLPGWIQTTHPWTSSPPLHYSCHLAYSLVGLIYSSWPPLGYTQVSICSFHGTALHYNLPACYTLSVTFFWPLWLCH